MSRAAFQATIIDALLEALPKTKASNYSVAVVGRGLFSRLQYVPSISKNNDSGTIVMNLFELLSTGHRGTVFSTMSRYYGITGREAQTIVFFVAEPLNEAIRRKAESAEGMVSLLRAMSSQHLAHYFNDHNIYGNEGAREDGLDILALLLGSEFARHQIALQASRRSDISLELVEHVLPIIALLSISALHRKIHSPMSQLAIRMTMEQKNKQWHSNPFELIADLIANDPVQDHGPTLTQLYFSRLFAPLLTRHA